MYSLLMLRTMRMPCHAVSRAGGDVSQEPKERLLWQYVQLTPRLREKCIISE